MPSTRAGPKSRGEPALLASRAGKALGNLLASRHPHLGDASRPVRSMSSEDPPPASALADADADPPPLEAENSLAEHDLDGSLADDDVAPDDSPSPRPMRTSATPRPPPRGHGRADGRRGRPRRPCGGVPRITPPTSSSPSSSSPRTSATSSPRRPPRRPRSSAASPPTSSPSRPSPSATPTTPSPTTSRSWTSVSTPATRSRWNSWSRTCPQASRSEPPRRSHPRWRFASRERTRGRTPRGSRLHRRERVPETEVPRRVPKQTRRDGVPPRADADGASETSRARREFTTETQTTDDDRASRRPNARRRHR